MCLFSFLKCEKGTELAFKLNLRSAPFISQEIKNLVLMIRQPSCRYGTENYTIRLTRLCDFPGCNSYSVGT